MISKDLLEDCAINQEKGIRSSDLALELCNAVRCTSAVVFRTIRGNQITEIRHTIPTNWRIDIIM
jgi:hypothetical protein